MFSVVFGKATIDGSEVGEVLILTKYKFQLTHFVTLFLASQHSIYLMFYAALGGKISHFEMFSMPETRVEKIANRPDKAHQLVKINQRHLFTGVVETLKEKQIYR